MERVILPLWNPSRTGEQATILSSPALNAPVEAAAAETSPIRMRNADSCRLEVAI